MRPDGGREHGPARGDDVEVLIVGAGPTGLTLACELARRGVSLHIVEASSGPQPGSRGKGIQPRTLQVFDDLGILDPVLANGRLGMPFKTVGLDGRAEISQAALLPSMSETPFTATLITPEWRIEEALRTRLAELGGKVSFGSELVALEQSDVGVAATVVDDGGTQILIARWLVGCDGGRSTVRRRAGIPFIGETRQDVRMIVADVGVDGLDREHWHTWRGDEGFLALCPLPSTDVYQLQASVGPGQNPALTLANLQALVARRAGRTDIRVREPSWSSLWRCNVRMVDRYRDGRVFLAGDAAHVHAPTGAQGMNTGIQDAYNLGWKLAAVLQGAPPALLDTYEEERLPVAASVLALSNELLQKAIETRGIVFPRTERALQLGVSYRGSSLSRGDREEEATLRAGDRAPDAPGLSGVNGVARLSELLRGPHATLLAFGPDSAGELEAVVERSKGRIRSVRIVSERACHREEWQDTHGHARRVYEAQPGTAIVIRPDGYIGLMGTTTRPNEVVSYLHQLLEITDQRSNTQRRCACP
ncbi:MAG: 3-(3-hydroxyphenyl)propionate hydroxylase [Alphaproteobacteria bacterium]|nr:MAG: 3-(3-hydroxyphenyl)propionate hydroxylase [Alphaproteobacteria bacterium]